MNKSVTAHLGGVVFHLDEAAYNQLRVYLDAVRHSLSATEGAHEIMQDVESRIAEMLTARMAGIRQVVLPSDIDAVVAEMGRPEDFGTPADPSTSTSAGTGASGPKFFRDPDDKIIGGVCSGISAYFNIDAIWIRLAFVFLFLGLGTGVLFYIILWAVIPEAKSSADKLRMRGEPVTLSNIERNIKDELNEVRQRAEKFAKDGVTGKRVEVKGFFHFLGKGVRVAVKVLGTLFAGFFLLIALVVIFALFASLFAVLMHVPGLEYPLIARSVFTNEGQFEWTIAGLLLVVGIPFLAIAWSAARFLFNVRLPRLIGFMALGIWLLGIALVLFLAFGTLNEFKEEEVFKSRLVIDSLNSVTLTVKAMNAESMDSKEDDDDGYWFFDETQKSILSSDIKLDVERSPDGKFRLLDDAFSRGTSKKNALANATRIKFQVERENDSTLVLDRYFSLEAGERFRNQHVRLTLQIPEGKSIYLDPSLGNLLYDVENVQNIHDKDMTGRHWLMLPAGLSCLDCTGREERIGDQR